MKTKLLSVILCALMLASCGVPAATVTQTGASAPDTKTQNLTASASDGTNETAADPYAVITDADGRMSIDTSSYLPWKLESDGKVWNVGDGYDYLRNYYPATDGSLIMKDYEAALKSVLYGISLEKARESICYGGAFYNNLHRGYLAENAEDGGKCFSFAPPPTKEQTHWFDFLSEKDDAFFKLVEIPLTVSALYVGVNENNPVENLSLNQFKDVFSGKIKNWKEVGGNDAAITLFGSGEQTWTQNYLDDLLDGKRGGITVTDDPASIKADEGGVFCTLYTFTSEDRLPRDGVKYISIDGVEPSRESAADKSYPLLSANCLLYMDNTDPYARLYIEFASKKEVRNAAAAAGYVTYLPSEVVFESENEKTFTPYSGVGTGNVPEGAALDAEGYDEEAINARYIQTYDFSVIANETLRSEMIAFTQTSLKKLNDREQYLIKKARITADLAGEFSLQYAGRPEYIITVINDYVSIRVGSSWYWDNIELSQNIPVSGDNGWPGRGFMEAGMVLGDTAVWQLSTGKRLTLEECFAEGVDVSAALNRLAAKYTKRIKKVSVDYAGLGIDPDDYYGPPMECYNAELSVPVAAREFTGLTTEDCWKIDAFALCFTDGNPWFDVPLFVPLYLLEPGTMVWDYKSDNSAFLKSRSTQ